jgi:hypothetical protein
VRLKNIHPSNQLKRIEQTLRQKEEFLAEACTSSTLNQDREPEPQREDRGAQRGELSTCARRHDDGVDPHAQSQRHPANTLRELDGSSTRRACGLGRGPWVVHNTAPHHTRDTATHTHTHTHTHARTHAHLLSWWISTSLLTSTPTPWAETTTARRV